MNFNLRITAKKSSTGKIIKENILQEIEFSKKFF